MAFNLMCVRYMLVATTHAAGVLEQSVFARHQNLDPYSGHHAALVFGNNRELNSIQVFELTCL